MCTWFPDWIYGNNRLSSKFAIGIILLCTVWSFVPERLQVGVTRTRRRAVVVGRRPLSSLSVYISFKFFNVVWRIMVIIRYGLLVTLFNNRGTLCPSFLPHSCHRFLWSFPRCDSRRWRKIRPWRLMVRRCMRGARHSALVQMGI